MDRRRIIKETTCPRNSILLRNIVRAKPRLRPSFGQNPINTSNPYHSLIHLHPSLTAI